MALSAFHGAVIDKLLRHFRRYIHKPAFRPNEAFNECISYEKKIFHISLMPTTLFSSITFFNLSMLTS